MPDTVSIPAAVAHDFTDAWCSAVIPADVATSLRCAEVDALADLLRALGAGEAADEWIEIHAEGDEPRDSHFQGTVPADVSLTTDGMRWSSAPADSGGG